MNLFSSYLGIIPRDLHFSDPHALFQLLWIIPLALLIVRALRYNQRALKAVAAPSLLPLITHTQHHQSLSWVYAGIGWTLAVVALMQPQGNGQSMSQASPLLSENTISTFELYLLIDASQSMAVPDEKNHTTRFDRAVEIADQLIARLSGNQVVLNTFTSSINQVIPLTYDKIFVRLILKEIHLNEGDQYGTNYTVTLNQLSEQELSLYPHQPKLILMLSDGGDNSLESLSGEPLQLGLQALKTSGSSLTGPHFYCRARLFRGVKSQMS